MPERKNFLKVFCIIVDEILLTKNSISGSQFSKIIISVYFFQITSFIFNEKKSYSNNSFLNLQNFFHFFSINSILEYSKISAKNLLYFSI